MSDPTPEQQALATFAQQSITEQLDALLSEWETALQALNDRADPQARPVFEAIAQRVHTTHACTRKVVRSLELRAQLAEARTRHAEARAEAAEALNARMLHQLPAGKPS